MRKNKSTLSNLEDILAEFEYITRYEKGDFTSGYCILNHKKVIVINKYFTTEGRISVLIDIFKELYGTEKIEITALKKEENQKLLQQVLKK